MTTNKKHIKEIDKDTIYAIANSVNLNLYSYIKQLPKHLQDQTIREVLVLILNMYNKSCYSNKI